MSHTDVKKGDVIAGKYRVDRVLGTGGMGIVVAATHIDLHERRALKLLRRGAMEKPDLVERFLREGRAAARLKGEHVTKVYDVGRFDDGTPYLVMEHLEGTDLGVYGKIRGAIPVGEAAGYGVQVCAALAEAHAFGVVHRDIKPANLFLIRRADGSTCIKVLDFGISKVTGGGEDEVTLTHEILGSPHYMSPEQMRASRSVDPRSDIWSVGVVLYKLVTGELPFSGGNITELIAGVLAGEVPRPSELRPGAPKAFDDIVLRCLQQRREDRFQSAADLAQALAPLASGPSLSPLLERLRAMPPPRGLLTSGVAPDEISRAPLASIPEISAPGAGAPTGRSFSGPPRLARRARAPAVLAGGIGVIALLVLFGYVARRTPATLSATSAPAVTQAPARPDPAPVQPVTTPPVDNVGDKSASRLVDSAGTVEAPVASAPTAGPSASVAPAAEASSAPLPKRWPSAPKPAKSAQDPFGMGRH